MANPTYFPTVVNSTCTGLLADGNGLITEAVCTGTPPTTANVFEVGCRMIQTDATSGNTMVYTNSGTSAAPVWGSSQLEKTVSLAAADIIAMYATPVSIVPAVTGKAIVLDSMEFVITRTSTAFTGGGVVAVQYDSTANGAGTATTATIAATVVTGAAGTTYTARIPVNLSDIASASISNIGLYISNQTAAFAAGTGTASVKVRYHLV
jgi:hypothetical protein